MSSGPFSFTAVTSLGAVPLRGRLSTDTDKPVLLATGGIFPPRTDLDWLPELVPEADVVLTHLPGMWTPHLAERSLDAWHKAFGEIIRTIFVGRRVIPVGVSTGALLSLGLGHLVDEMVLIEPFLQPSKLAYLWRLIGMVLEGKEHRPEMEAYARMILGAESGDGVLDYTHLADRAPARLHVVVGGLLPDAQAPSRAASLTLAEERAMWATKGAVQVLAGVGHDIPGRAQDQMVAALRAVARGDSGR